MPARATGVASSFLLLAALLTPTSVRADETRGTPEITSACGAIKVLLEYVGANASKFANSNHEEWFSKKLADIIRELEAPPESNETSRSWTWSADLPPVWEELASFYLARCEPEAAIEMHMPLMLAELRQTLRSVIDPRTLISEEELDELLSKLSEQEKKAIATMLKEIIRGRESANDVADTVIEAKETAPEEYKTSVFHCVGDFEICRSYFRSKSAFDAAVGCGVTFLVCMGQQLVPFAGSK